MPVQVHPLRALLLSVAGLVHRQQQSTIEYLVEENRVLKEQLGSRRLRLTDDQRRRLAVKGKAIGRRALRQLAKIVPPDTILRWHRTLIAAKWTYPSGRIGRPGVLKQIRDLAVRFALENSTWGYGRIQGALMNVGHDVARSTIAKVLKGNGIQPAPERPTSWRTFLRAHWREFAATDFFTAVVWTPTGLKTYYVLFLIRLKTRRVHVAGITRNPNDMFMERVAERSLPFLQGIKQLICDRDTKFSKRFRIVLQHAGIQLVRTPVRAPDANAYAERFVLSVKTECLNRIILFGEAHLRRVLAEYVEHYHGVGAWIEARACPSATTPYLKSRLYVTPAFPNPPSRSVRPSADAEQVRRVLQREPRASSAWRELARSAESSSVRASHR